MPQEMLENMRGEIKNIFDKYMELARSGQETVPVEEFKPVTYIFFNSNSDTWKKILVTENPSLPELPEKDS